MKTTLSLKHHLFPQPFSQNTIPFAINPLGRHHRYHSLLFPRFPLCGIRVGIRVGTPPPRPHLMIKSQLKSEGDKNKMMRRPSKRFMILASLRSDKVVRKRAEEALEEAGKDPNLLVDAYMKFVNHMEKQEMEWGELQGLVWKLEMNGEEDEAARVLKERYDKEVNDKELEAGGDASNAYELGLLLVEIMIYQGNYKPAKRICTTLRKEKPQNDARPLLYLAATGALLGKVEEAEKNWKEFAAEQSDALKFEDFLREMEKLEDEVAIG